MSDRHTWQCWCEHEDCDWSIEVSGGTSAAAQNMSSSKMIAHGIETGHHETRREEVSNSRNRQ